MLLHASIAHRNETRYIRLNTHKCKACWDCVTECPQHVLGKIDLLFHKHARIDHPDNCKGCMRCVKTCLNGAITPVEKTHDNPDR